MFGQHLAAPTWTEADLRRHRRRQKENYFKVRFNYREVMTTTETARHLEPAEFFDFLQMVLDRIKAAHEQEKV